MPRFVKVREVTVITAKNNLGNSLVAQWLGLNTLTARGSELFSGWGTKIPQALQHGQKKLINYRTWKAAAAKSLQSCPILQWQPTRLLSPWDSPGKDTGVGCHFLLHWKDEPSLKEGPHRVFISPLFISPSVYFSVPISPQLLILKDCKWQIEKVVHGHHEALPEIHLG